MIFLTCLLLVRCAPYIFGTLWWKTLLFLLLLFAISEFHLLGFLELTSFSQINCSGQSWLLINCLNNQRSGFWMIVQISGMFVVVCLCAGVFARICTLQFPTWLLSKWYKLFKYYWSGTSYISHGLLSTVDCCDIKLNCAGEHSPSFLFFLLTVKVAIHKKKITCK